MSEKDYKPWTDKQERFGKKFIKSIAKYQTWVYEKTNGRIWNKFLGVHCAILTTTGKKTGLPRKTPLLYLKDGDNIVMVASQGGFSTEPFWYKNLLHTPQAQVQIGAEKYQVTARNATEEEAADLWPKLDAIYKGYAEYRARTKGIRVIPIVIFTPEN